MSEIEVVGGLYRERCLYPMREVLYGSGGRATCVLAALGHRVHLHTAADADAKRRFEAHANTFDGISSSFATIRRTAQFSYVHPLAVPIVRPPLGKDTKPTIRVAGKSVLCFGMLDAEIVVDGMKVVYDPQSPESPASFRTVGRADDLVIVLNESEAIALSGEKTVTKAAQLIASREGALAVLVKRGPRGCLGWIREAEFVFDQPCYRTESIYKVGSGDVFSAVFFREWALRGCDVPQATDAAARATAVYCEGGEELKLRPGCYDDSARTWLPGRPISDHRGVYLAGPFFTTAQRWLVAEVHRALEDFDLKVFSPFHDVGLGSSEEVVCQDLVGLEGSSVLLALIDGNDTGTVFEIGYAGRSGKKSVVLAENTPPEMLTMLRGSGCEIFSDLTAALYACCWEQ